MISYSARFKRAIVLGVHDFLSKVYVDSLANTPVVTGRLKSSAQLQLTNTGGAIVYTAPYATYVESRDKSSATTSNLGSDILSSPKSRSNTIQTQTSLDSKGNIDNIFNLVMRGKGSYFLAKAILKNEKLLLRSIERRLREEFD